MASLKLDSVFFFFLVFFAEVLSCHRPKHSHQYTTQLTYCKLLGPETVNFCFHSWSLLFLPLSFCFPLCAEVVESDVVDVIVVNGCAEADEAAGVEGEVESGGQALSLEET